MHPLEEEIQEILERYKSGEIVLEEKNYLLCEIRDIRAAKECVSDEVMFRYVIEAADFAIKMI